MNMQKNVFDKNYLEDYVIFHALKSFAYKFAYVSSVAFPTRIILTKRLKCLIRFDF